MRDRNVLLFVAVSLVAGFGSTAMLLTSGVWVMSLTGSASLAGLTGIGIYLPSLFGPVLGVLVDRVPRRRLLIATSLGLAALVLGLLAVHSAAQVWLVFAVMLGYGIGFVLIDAAESAVLPASVDGDVLPRLNGARFSAQEGVKLVAPLAGAALFAAAGGGSVALVSAGALVAAAALYASLRLAPPVVRPDVHSGADTPSRRLWRQTREGVRALWATPRLGALTLTAAGVVTLSAVATPAMYAVVTAGLHRPPAFLGVLSALQGAGSIAGGMVAGRVLARRGEAFVCAAGAAVFAVAAALQAIQWLPTALAGSVLVGVGLPWTIVAVVTSAQRTVPDDLLGRVVASINTMIFAPLSFAAVVGSAALTVIDQRVLMAVVAVGAAAAGTALARRRSWDRQHPIGADRADNPKIDERARAGRG